ncbi:MAG: DNA internalization-related competence protein ComEC/Rec2 [Gammaproteobacteria bacterium]
MFRAALLVIVFGCAIRTVPALPAILTQPVVLAAAVPLAWMLGGSRITMAVATIAWSLINIDWGMEARLAPDLVGADILMTGTICDFPRDDERAQRFVFVPEPDASDGTLPARVYLASYGALSGDLAGGQRWRLKVRLKRPRGLSNPGGFDFERWALENRIGATGYVRRSAANTRLPRSRTACPTIVLRQAIATGIERALGNNDTARFMLALAIGARHQIRQNDWVVMRRTGTVHLMAISGLHVGLVAGLMWWFGRAIASAAVLAGIHCSTLAAARLFALAGAFSYAMLAGFAVPTLRAFVMVAVVTVLISSRRTAGAWQVLATAVIAVNWVDPLAMIGSGFWLSFGAVAFLMLAALAIQPNRATDDRSWPGVTGARLRLMVRAQLSLSIGLAPLALLFFTEVSLISPVVNLLVVPIFAFFIVPLTLLGTALLAYGEDLAAPVLNSAAWMLGHGFDLLEPLSAWPGAARQAAIPGAGWLAVGCICGWCAAWPAPLRSRGLALAAAGLLAWRVHTVPVPELRIVVMDVGQGLAVLVQTPEHALLYDAGPAFGRRDAGRSVVLPVLRHLGIRRLDVVVASHGDNDHVGGVQTVIDAFPEATLIATDSFGLTVREVELCAAGMRWRWNDVEFRILAPPGSASRPRGSDNDLSCVLSVVAPRASLLLPGDVERRGELDLVAAHDVRPHDIVVAPHHGSATSSSQPFISAVAPRYVVFATGFLNRWGFPDEQVVRRWGRTAACLLETGVDGALTFEVDLDGALRPVTRHRDGARRVWSAAPPKSLACAPSASTN